LIKLPPPPPPPPPPLLIYHSSRPPRIYCLLELNMLCLNVTRGYGDHSPLTRPKEEVTHGGRCRRGRVCRCLGGGGSRFAYRMTAQTRGPLKILLLPGKCSRAFSLIAWKWHGLAHHHWSQVVHRGPRERALVEPEGGVVHGGRGPRRGDPREIGGERDV
jgi:hypothetical protein